MIDEFIVIVESGADARTATKLAERILIEKIDWLEPEIINHIFCWTGLLEGTEYSCWKDINKIVELLKASGFKFPRYRSNRNSEPLKADGAASIKILNVVRSLQRTRQIKAVIFIRDLDNQPERKEGIEQARLEHINLQPKLEIVIGAANPKREAWVLNGFVPSNQNEKEILEEIKTKLCFDPCRDSHKLRSVAETEPERVRNAKVVVAQLTDGNMEREKLCWEDTDLKVLREIGMHTGLTDYIQEVEQRLIPIISSE